MNSPLPRPDPTDLAPRLLPWFETHGRDMPWRRDRNPYRLLVAVMMLQQTQVATVIPYYRRFLKAFPSVRALAAADVAEVLKLWEGLGYYSRARNLHRAAQIVVAEHRGSLPRSAEAFRALPGAGPYTVAAVLSIAHDEPLAAVDGNVLRILARVFWLPGGAREGKEKGRAERLAQAAVPPERAGEYNQALMDLGALICTPRSPACGACPLQEICRAHARGQADTVPPRRRMQTRDVRAVAALVEKKNRLLLAHRPPQGVWGGLWELPNCVIEADADPAAALTAYLAEAFGLQVETRACCAEHTHGLTNRRVNLSVLRAVVVGGRLKCREHDCARWIAPAELDEYTLPAPHRRVLQELVGGSAVGRACC